MKLIFMPGLMLTVTRVKQINAENSIYDKIIAGISVETSDVPSDELVLA